MRIQMLLVILLGLFLTGISCTDSTEKQVTKLPAEAPARYQEVHRPQYHFSPDSMWMNDPNGMVYYGGEYHLFYQYYPDSTVWGPMHWGHAVSDNLTDWDHLPIAIYPDSLGLIFSGSAVLDWNNTSGLADDAQPPLVAIFTQHLMEAEKAGRNDFQVQSVAYSLDKGRSWSMYKGNPVIPNPDIRDFRDPKVSWHEASQRWVMVMAAGDHIKFYSSPNLLDWQHESDFGKNIGAHGGVWECPDLFPLKVNGKEDSTKWVLLVSINPGAPNGGSGTQYFIGDFNGKEFILDEAFAERLKKDTALWVDYGTDNYAGVSWSDIPKEDGRRIFLGWMSNWSYAQMVPTERWRSAMTVPRVMTLSAENGETNLFTQPASELKQLREYTAEISQQTVSDELIMSSLLDTLSPLMELELALSWDAVNEPSIIKLELSNSKGEQYVLAYDLKSKQYYTDRTYAGKSDFEAGFASKHYAPRLLTDNHLDLHLFTDVASAETFADDGRTVLTDIFFPNEDFTQLTLKVEGGAVNIETGEIHRLKSIW